MLYKISELSDLYADACIRDEYGELMFLSLYGRDTAIQQLLAAFSLKEGYGGLSGFRLTPANDGDGHAAEQVHVRSPDRLTKFSGRLPKENLFGNLVHTWIYDEALLKPDRSNKSAWLMLDEPFTQEARPRLLDGIWSLYKILSPVPLLDGWKEVVIRATQAQCVRFMEDGAYPPIGNVTAARVTLNDTFADDVSRMIQAHMIGLDGEETVYLEKARRQAAT
jgi:hypothetical protein